MLPEPSIYALLVALLVVLLTLLKRWQRGGMGLFQHRGMDVGFWQWPVLGCGFYYWVKTARIFDPGQCLPFRDGL